MNPNITPDYAEAAQRILTPAASDRYLKGDYEFLTDIEHEMISEEASKVAAERIEQHIFNRFNIDL